MAVYSFIRLNIWWCRQSHDVHRSQNIGLKIFHAWRRYVCRTRKIALVSYFMATDTVSDQKPSMPWLRRDGLARVLYRTSSWVSVFVKYMITWLVPVSHPHCTHDHPGGNTSPEMEAKRQHRIIRIIYSCSFTCACRTCLSRNLNTCNQWRLLCLRVTSIMFCRYAHFRLLCPNIAVSF
jgi:hypothetical protein